jgi:fido (protein-threonine AMPylation protein)
MICPPWRESPDPEGLRAAIERIVRQELDDSLPLTTARIEQWHRLLFAGRVTPEEYLGAVRQMDPQRPCLGRLVAAAGGVGMSAEGVPAAMDALCDQINRAISKAKGWSMPPERKTLALANLLTKIAVPFLSIHPFLDGNSRMVRLLLLVVTQRLGLPALLAVIPPLDPAFSELKRAAMRKDEGPWLAYIVRALAAGGSGGVGQMNP